MFGQFGQPSHLFTVCTPYRWQCNVLYSHSFFSQGRISKQGGIPAHNPQYFWLPGVLKLGKPLLKSGPCKWALPVCRGDGGCNRLSAISCFGGVKTLARMICALFSSLRQCQKSNAVFSDQVTINIFALLHVNTDVLLC